MPSQPSVAPKGRINIKYDSEQGLQEIPEIPMKYLVVGDFIGQGDDADPAGDIKERPMRQIHRKNFDDVMATYRINKAFTAPNMLFGEGSGDIAVNISFSSMKDFEPAAVIEQLRKSSPELDKVFRLREALLAVLNPMKTQPQFRKIVQDAIEDKTKFEQIKSDFAGHYQPRLPAPDADRPE
ncbi:MAG: type VI secretion system contractile sheath small subunit [Maricaulaceae bacterium]